MEDQSLTKKERREQRKAVQVTEQMKASRQANQRKWFIVFMVIVAVIVVVGVIRAISGFGDGPTSGDAPDPTKGNVNATVHVVEYSDFQCPFCATTGPLLSRLATEFGDKISIEYNDFPLTTIHDNAFPAAEAAQCAFQQDKFWEYHDTLFLKQSAWSIERDPLDLFKQYASELELDTEQFADCVQSHDTRASIREDMQEGAQADVSGTPTIFVNGNRVADTQTYTAISAAVQEALNENTAPTE